MGRARAFEGISQDAMAAISGYTRQYLSQVEKGDREPTIRLLHLYARETGHKDLLWLAYGLEVEDLLHMASKATRYDMAQQMLQHS